MPGTGYLLDNRDARAGHRFDSLAEVFDPVTFRHLEAVGVDPGWRCWEVGTGGPSVPRWMADRVGPTGRVLATDIDVTWVEGLVPPNVEVLEHDVALDDFPWDGFDLVHARLVLSHVPGREQALASMVGALRPGGSLLIEDFDVAMQPLACPDARRSDHHRANKVRNGFLGLLEQRGVDLRFGRRLSCLLRQAGLRDVAADSYFPIAMSAVAKLEKANVNQVREDLVAGGCVSAGEIDEHLALVADGGLDLATPPLVSAWGVRPE